jgi:hypothetical protein
MHINHAWKPEKRRYLEDLSIDGRILLKYLKEMGLDS